MRDLRAELVRLGPWHLDVEVGPELSTRASLEAPPGTYERSKFGPVPFRSPREGFVRRIKRLFPNGLQGRSVLDCGCNCGGYLFWAKELGAGACLGIDIRAHWIEQARFLAEHRHGPGADVRFERRDLYELPDLGLEPFDITLLNGILYHLPNPIRGLEIAAEVTRELVLVNTAARTDLPDGMLVAAHEGVRQVMSGVHGLGWFPTGPEVVATVLARAGFEHSRCSRWRRSVVGQEHALGRVEVLGARDKAVFVDFDRELTAGELEAAIRSISDLAVPAGATVAIAGGEAALPESPGDAQYLIVPSTVPLDDPDLAALLERDHRLEFRELGVCDVYSLADAPKP